MRVREPNGPMRTRRPVGPRRALADIGLTFLVVVAVGAMASLCLQGIAEAATSVTSRSPASYSVNQTGLPPTIAVTVQANATIVATSALTALGAAGAQRTGALGLAGTPTAIPGCLVATCKDQFIVASPVGLTAGNYADEVNLSIRQPFALSGTSQGFLVDIEIHLSTGWFAGRAYLATGTTSFPGGSTITVLLYMNLGTTSAPTVLHRTVVVDACSTPTVCP